MIDAESTYGDETQDGQTVLGAEIGRESKPFETAVGHTLEDLKVGNLEKVVLGLVEIVLVAALASDLVESVKGELIGSLGYTVVLPEDASEIVDAAGEG